MSAVYRRELRAYFAGMTAYVFIAFLLLFAGIYTMAYNLSNAYPNFEYVLQSMSIIFLIAIPILTMRVIAEERRQKTDQLLYALPIGMTRVVLGKYLAMITVVAIPCAIMGVYPLILRSFGNVPLGTAYGTLLAFFLLSCTLSAVGMLISYARNRGEFSKAEELIQTLPDSPIDKEEQLAILYQRQGKYEQAQGI